MVITCLEKLIAREATNIASRTPDMITAGGDVKLVVVRLRPDIVLEKAYAKMLHGVATWLIVTVKNSPN